MSTLPHRSRSGRFVLAVLGTLGLLVAGGWAVPAVGAAVPSGPTFRATPLRSSGTVQGSKDASNLLARSDPGLLASTSPQRTPMLVKLGYDALASYRGTVAGLAATSPLVTGHDLDLGGAAARSYGAFIAGEEASFVSSLRAAVPSATVTNRLRTVYGGVAILAPTRDAKRIAALPGVLAVQADGVRALQSDASADFVGAPTIYAQLGQTDQTAGQGSIVAVLDTGIWPEHPSFADRGPLVFPPVDLVQRPCDLGDNPLTPSVDVFACNDKVIAGSVFLDAADAAGVSDAFDDSARDADGHGSNVASIAAGNRVASPTRTGRPLPPIHGIAPGAYIDAIKVCAANAECFASDAIAGVQQAIADRADVINFSISGTGGDPLTDPVELAFLDAYDAGVFVATASGNAGDVGSVSHRAPWVTTVAASTHDATFRAGVTLGNGVSIDGAGTGAAVSTSPLVRAASAPWADSGCTTVAPPAMVDGRIVLCVGDDDVYQRSRRVRDAGGVGMVLVRSTHATLDPGEALVPTVVVQADQRSALEAYALTAGATASLTAANRTTGQGDVMATFSARGPGGPTIKPDLTAPGVQILGAGSPLTSGDVVAGQLFRVASGTSQASPQVAGSAALVAALHPTWTPGQVQSALLTTAKATGIVNDDGSATTVFDRGAGRLDLHQAGDPGLTFSATGGEFSALYGDPQRVTDLNLPSVDAPLMPGLVEPVRTGLNVTNQTLHFSATTTGDAPLAVQVTPNDFTVGPGQTIDLHIKLRATGLAPGQHFGSIELKEVGGDRQLHLPVAYVKAQGSAKLANRCTPTQVAAGATTTCTVTISNDSYAPLSSIESRTRVSEQLEITGASGAGATVPFKRQAKIPTAQLPAKAPADVQVAQTEETAAGFTDLEGYGIAPIKQGDESALDLTSPRPFRYGGDTYTSIGITSNGYVVAGGAEGSLDIQFTPQGLPDSARPNNVIAPFWTDLDDTSAEGMRAVQLVNTDTDERYLVVQWDTHLYGTTTDVVAQLWIGLNGVEDVFATYPGPQVVPGPSYGLTVGAENIVGTKGDQLGAVDASSGKTWRATTSQPLPMITYQVQVEALSDDPSTVDATLTAAGQVGQTLERASLNAPK